MNIALDLSTERCGIVKFNDEKILERFSISPDYKLHPYLKIKFIVDNLKPHLKEAENCLIEGIFLNTFASGQHGVVGFETLARLSGAVVNQWLETHEVLPTLLKATSARKLAGVKGNSQKAEIQVFVAQKFNLATEDQLDDFNSMIDAEVVQLGTKQFTKATWKKHMDQISTYIEGEISLGNDEADALILYLAYEAKRLGKV